MGMYDMSPTSTKYNSRQIIINRVNAKHIADKSPIRTRTERGTHIEKAMAEFSKWNMTIGESRLKSNMGDKLAEGLDY